MSRQYLCVVCPSTERVQNENTLWAPEYMRDGCWEGFNLNKFTVIMCFQVEAAIQ